MKLPVSGETLRKENSANRDRYNVTAWFYDFLDFPWELQYRKWRSGLVSDMRGDVLEAGVGTGRNLRHYQPSARVTAVDQSSTMLRKAAKRAREARCSVTLVEEDACRLESIPANSFDWVIATFLCCVIPEDSQRPVLEQFSRVLKPGGRFRLLEMIYSKDPDLRKRQEFFAPFVQRCTGPASTVRR